jgi:transcriptional regulator with XRE-family HTH domain
MSGASSDAHGGSKIGQTLALTRREQGLSLKEVEEATKIRAAYLGELEKENFDVLPPVYVQGSLKTYANFLHLDGEALVRELKRQRASVDPVEEERDPPAAVPRERSAPSGRRGTLPGGEIGSEGPVPADDRGASANLYGYLALVFAVFLTLALVAAVLVSSLAWNEESAVFDVREPLVAQAPEPTPASKDETGGAGRATGEDIRSPKDDGREPEDGGSRAASSPAGDGGDGGMAPAGQLVPAASTAQEVERLVPAAERRAPLLAKSPRPARTGSGTVSGTVSDAAPESPGAGISSSLAARNPSPMPVYVAPSYGGEAVPAPSTAGADFEVRIALGGDDLVRITGHPATVP